MNTKELITLSDKNLPSLKKKTTVPAYNRAAVSTGIVHIGIGNFHRAHQAYYSNQLLNTPGSESWGICGIALLEQDRKIYNVLKSQEGLYTLVINGSDGSSSANVIGSIVEYLFAPDNKAEVINKLAHAATKIVTLTITEGGYNYDAATNEFQFSNENIQWDLKNPSDPRTFFGFITQGLLKRKENNAGGLTILSADNIQHNGEVTKKMITAFVERAAPDLLEWIEKHVSFPNSMVDRITPVTTPELIQEVNETLLIDDEWPVTCEPFCQWIIEDKFVNERPSWEKVGVQFVNDVTPYEKMKIRLLNGGHSALGCTGVLGRFTYIYEVVADPVFRRFLKEYMDEEVTPVLDDVPGINIEKYKDELIQRFSNPYIKDKVTRILSESSAKIPRFIISTLQDQLRINGPCKRAILIIACWCNYLEQMTFSGEGALVQDEMKDILLFKAGYSVFDDPGAFIGLTNIFGNLSHSERFVSLYFKIIEMLRAKGIKYVLDNLDKI